MKSLNKILIYILLTQVSVANATSSNQNQFYGAINGGILQTQFNSKYLDQTDIIPQNVSNSLIQNGYTGGLALGFTHLINPRYFFSLELSGNLDGNSALFESGASSTAFSDQIQINNNIDFSVMPGIITQSAFFPYFKLGVSRASIQDSLTSPVGYDPVMTQYNTNKTAYGFVTGLGVRYLLNNQSWLFIEANYHDYGTINFSSFDNFSASYTHSAHVYSYAAIIGASFAFNI